MLHGEAHQPMHPQEDLSWPRCAQSRSKPMVLLTPGELAGCYQTSRRYQVASIAIGPDPE